MNNIYNYLIARHGEEQLRMNGHEYDVVIDNIRDNGIDCNAEFTGYLRSLTPRVNYSDMWKSYREQDKLRTRATYKSRSYI